MNTTVSITRRIDRKYYPVVLNPKNGTIKPGVVRVGGQETCLTGGNFYLSWHQGSRCIRESVGPDTTQALNRQKAKERDLKFVADGGQLKDAPAVIVQDGRQLLGDTVERYLAYIGKHRDSKTYVAYRKTLNDFLEACKQPHVEDITDKDLLAFSAWLRDKRHVEDRTVANKFVTVMGFLKWAEHKVKIRKQDWPKYDKQAPAEVYEPEDLDPFWAACTPKEHLLFKFFHMTGFREGEAAHFMWRDISQASRLAKVTAKPAYNWKPKMNKGREVPIPQALLTDLLAAHSEATSLLVFPGDDGQPDEYMLPKLKAIAKRAGLDPKNYWLHKFRSSFATKCIRNGVDLVTLQSWMGHTDLQSTMRYLRAAGGSAAQAKVEAVWA